MKNYHRIIVVFITFILLSISYPPAAWANAAEPPSLIVITANPPVDLSLSLRLPDQSQTEAIVLKKEHKAWETYYRFFNHMSPFRDNNLDGAVLIVQSSEHNFQCALTAATFNTYNNFLTLDLRTASITTGQPPLRTPVLVAIRVALTLLIEGAVFFLFGYREKRSWLAFFVINIMTQSGLNAMFTSPVTGSYWMIAFIFGEIMVVAVEMIAFICLVQEFKKSRVVLYTVAANLASLILGGLLITHLPV